jgi:hypothetical protein
MAVRLTDGAACAWVLGLLAAGYWVGAAFSDEGAGAGAAAVGLPALALAAGGPRACPGGRYVSFAHTGRNVSTLLGGGDVLCLGGESVLTVATREEDDVVFNVSGAAAGVSIRCSLSGPLSLCVEVDRAGGGGLLTGCDGYLSSCPDHKGGSCSVLWDRCNSLGGCVQNSYGNPFSGAYCA